MWVSRIHKIKVTGCLEFKWIVMDKIVIMGMSGWYDLEEKSLETKSSKDHLHGYWNHQEYWRIL